MYINIRYRNSSCNRRQRHCGRHRTRSRPDRNYVRTNVFYLFIFFLQSYVYNNNIHVRRARIIVVVTCLFIIIKYRLGANTLLLLL